MWAGECLENDFLHFFNRSIGGLMVNTHGTESQEVIGQLLRVPSQTCCARKGPIPRLSRVKILLRADPFHSFFSFQHVQFILSYPAVRLI